MTRRVLRCAVLAAVLCAAGQGSVAAQAAQGSLDWYDTQARQAITQGNYESAVKTLTDAKAKFPNATKIDVELADLYYDKELYPLALDEYKAAESKGSRDFHTLDQIARCLGKLNLDKESIDYLTRILTLFPDSADTIDDLGWMYFKTYQLEKGEKVLLDGLRKLGMQRNMAMTLGTIYAGLNDYDHAREYYLKSIQDARSAGDTYFASVAYYNLALLEENFYHYNSALSYTDESISLEDRSSGHLAKGELYQSRLDYSGALGEYEKAYASDSTPLTRVNLAVLYQRFGQLELARRYAEDALSTKDMAWMLYYGTDLTRHYQDIYQILGDTYKGISVEEATRPTSGLWDRVKALAVSFYDRVVAWYYRERYLLYSLSIGRQYEQEGRMEEAYSEFSNANERYPDVASSYLAKARVLETARTPHADAFYKRELGALTRSASLLEESVTELDPFWEKEASSVALTDLVPLLRAHGQEEARRDALNRLYDMNPGAFRQNGFGVPLLVDVKENDWGKQALGRILRYLGRAGSDVALGSSGPAGFRHALGLYLEPGDRVHYVITEVQTGRVTAEGDHALSGAWGVRCAQVAQEILDDLYRVQ